MHMTRRSNREDKSNTSKQEPIFSKEPPIAASIGSLFIVVLFLYFSWLTLDRLIELVNALSTGQIEVHFASYRSRTFSTEISNWHEHPWKFSFSVAWVTAEMAALVLLCCGCINALKNITIGAAASKNRQ